jgi:hypothetical protein
MLHESYFAVVGPMRYECGRAIKCCGAVGAGLF